MEITYPSQYAHKRGLPNVETLQKKAEMKSPSSKVPHVPSICRACNVMDDLPEDGPRPTKMHWSGLCLRCYVKTPEGAAALEAGLIELPDEVTA
jgi:hypothetical protein